MNNKFDINKSHYTLGTFTSSHFGSDINQHVLIVTFIRCKINYVFDEEINI